ncbi:MAG: thermonuclease family protein [Flavobacteriaceae bacterium]|jgi:endonuclease YncB( thermonuclease family)|nr:thermonuclease family protein [Flavobacteriaceae bacterium]
MKKNSVVLAILFFSSFQCQTGKIVGIKDGDTVVILVDGNVQKILRLAEVDCPKSGQPFGNNAKQFTSGEIYGKIIEYVQTDTDQYGRIITEIYYDDGKYLSAELIKSGLGWWYYHYSDNKELGELEKTAREQKIGLWQDKNAVAPWEWRRKK